MGDGGWWKSVQLMVSNLGADLRRLAVNSGYQVFPFSFVFGMVGVNVVVYPCTIENEEAARGDMQL